MGNLIKVSNATSVLLKSNERRLWRFMPKETLRDLQPNTVRKTDVIQMKTK